MADFHFNVHMDGKITFEIHYEEGVLPEAFPEARTRVSRAAKAAVKPPPRTAQRLWPQNKSRIPFCSSICYNPKNKIGSCRGEAMKISKVVLSIITILSAVLGLTKVLAFDITNPIMLTSLATLLLLRSVEYKNNRDRSGFILTCLTAVFVYFVVIYKVFIG